MRARSIATRSRNSPLLERAVLSTFPEAERLRTGEILRWPGVLAESGVAPEALRDAVLACGKQAITDLIDVRAREGAHSRRC